MWLAVVVVVVRGGGMSGGMSGSGSSGSSGGSGSGSVLVGGTYHQLLLL